MNRICFIGELNPYGTDPARALYPFPRHASGNHLREILQLTDREYVYRYDRMNLCQRYWSLKTARVAAQTILEERRAHGGKHGLVLCGAQVAAAFDLPYRPGITTYPANSEIALLSIPHPSGRCRAWNDHDILVAVRESFKQLQRTILPLDARPSLQ